MKKIIALLVAIIATMTVNAQVANYRTTKFYTRENTSRGWTKWSSPQSSNLLLQIDFDNDCVYIGSQYEQLYKITGIKDQYTTREGDKVVEFTFIDQDGDRGTISLTSREYGASQIYIRFNNVNWCYDVVKL